MYTAKEISTIADKFKELVAERKIGFQLDAFGNPEADYTKEAADQLVGAITDLDSFPAKEVVENAMLDASTKHYVEIFADFNHEFAPDIESRVFKTVQCAIYDAALLEIPEHLFTTKQIQAMLRQHPDYLSTREQDIRIGRLEREELEDLKRLETGIQTQSEFNKTFSEVA